MISNTSGLILGFERIEPPGAWQLPQGGLKGQETPLQGVYREVYEETALAPDQLALQACYPDPLVYELPVPLRNAKVGRGQVLYCFLFRLLGKDGDIELSPGEEFRSWKWLSFPELLATVVAFRKPVYQKLAAWVLTGQD